MAIEWGEYLPAESIFAWTGRIDLFRALPRRQARVAFNEFIAAREDRLSMIDRLLRANNLAFPQTDDQLNAVNDWFLDNVEPDLQRVGEVSPRWVGVIHDLRVLLGELQISRMPGYRWELWDRKTLNYNQPVVAEPPKKGFRRQVDYFFLLYSTAVRQVYRMGRFPRDASIEMKGSTIDLTRFYQKTAETSSESERGAFVRYLKQG